MNKNAFLTIYGFFRMTLGISALVALCGGYFLKEWILAYPLGVTAFLFDQELVAVTSLAVIMRSSFHLIAGILLIRLNSFVKSWLMFGWPIIAMITFGVVYIYFEQWQRLGNVESIGQVIFLPSMIVYLGFIIFDIVLMTQLSPSENQESSSAESPFISWNQIVISIVIVVAIMSLVLYLGKPIKKGFHKGFYKTQGEYGPAESKVVQNNESMGDRDQKSVKDLTTDVNEAVFSVKQKAIEEVNENPEIKEVVNAPKIQAISDNEGFSYVAIIGWLAALCFILAVVFKFIEQSMLSDILLSVGFLMICVYAVPLKLWPMVVAGLMSGIGFLAGIFYRHRS